MTRDQRKLAAIMFTDMVGYSALAQKNEALALEFLQEHRRLLRPLFTKHGGNEIKTIGDAFLIEFSSAIGAVNCAIEMHDVLDEYNTASLETDEVKIRIGIHIGDIVFHENDVYGDGVNIASRVESLAEPGGICITEDVYRLVHNKMQFPVVRLGRSELKNIGVPIAIYRVLRSSDKEAFSFQSYLNFLFRRKSVRNRLIAAVIAVFALVGVLQIFSHIQVTDEERLPVMVADFDNQTGEEGLNGLSDMFVTFLGRSNRLNVIPRSEMLQIFKHLKMEQVGRVDEMLGKQICEKENINVLVTATVRKFGDVYIIEMKVLDPLKGKFLVTLKEDGRGYESIPTIIEELSEKTTQRLEENADELINQLAKNPPGVIGAKVYQYYLEGEEQFQRLDYEWAEEKLQRTLALDPDFALANYRLACLMWERGDKRAKEPIELAMKVAPTIDEKTQQYIIGLQHDIWQRTDQAVKTYQDLLKKNPEDKEALYMIGDLLFRKTDFQNATIYLEKAIAVDPKFERAYVKLIASAQAAEHHARMIEYANEYLSKVGSESAYQQLAMAYIVAGNFNLARQTYLQALDKYPNSLSSTLGIGKIYIYDQNFDKAETVFKSLLQKGKPVKEKKAGLRALAELYAYLGRYREAIQLMDEIIQINEELKDKRGLALSYAEKMLLLVSGPNDIKAALEVKEKINQLSDASDQVAAFYLFNAYLLMGRYEDALATSKTQLSRGFPFSRVNVVIANVDRLKGRYQDAISFLKDESQWGVCYDKVFVKYLLSECYALDGDLENARQTIAQVKDSKLQADPQAFGLHAIIFPRTYYIDGLVNEKNGNHKAALDNYKRLLSLWKNADPDLLLLNKVKTHVQQYQSAKTQ